MRYDRENLSVARIEIRLTPEEKELIKKYCADRNMTVSEFVRIACAEAFRK